MYLIAHCSDEKFKESSLKKLDMISTKKGITSLMKSVRL